MKKPINKLEQAAKLRLSAAKIRKTAGINTNPQRHNSIVAMRIGRADALEVKANQLVHEYEILCYLKNN